MTPEQEAELRRLVHTLDVMGAERVRPLLAALDAARGEAAAEKRRADVATRLIAGLDKLLVSYRLGRPPAGSTLDGIRRDREALRVMGEKS